MLKSKQNKAAYEGDLKPGETTQTIGASWYTCALRECPSLQYVSPSQAAKPSMETCCLRSQEKKPLHDGENVAGIPEGRA